MPRILAATFVLSLCHLPVAAGPGGSSIAEREIARREGLVLQAQELLTEGDAARKAKDFAAAVAAYRQAYEILPAASSTLELRGRALHSFSEVSVVHAEMLAMNARYDEANAALDAVLLPDWNPEYKPALKLKQQIQDPEHYNPAATPAHVEKVGEVERLLRMAQGHFDLGEFDLAAEHFNRVLAVDRYNVAARRGLEMVERRISQHHQSSRGHSRASMLRAVEEQWETAVPPRLQSNGGLVSHPALGGEPLAAGMMVREKLHTLIVPQIQLVDATLDEAVQYVASLSRSIDTVEPDPSKRGINIVLGGDATLANRRLSIFLQNVPLEYVLETMARDAGTGLQIGDYLVTIGPSDPTALEMRTYRVPPNFFTASAPSAMGAGDPFSGGDSSSSNLAFTRLSAQDILTQNGVTFPEGASATFSPITGLMTVRNTAENHDTIRSIVDNVSASAPKMVRLQCTIIEVNQDNAEEIGFDWLLGQFNIGGSAKVFGGGGTQGNQAGGTAQNFPFVPPVQDAQPVGQFPVTAGNRSGNGAIQPNSIDSLLAGQRGVDLSLKAPGVFGLAGVYTDAAFQVVLRGINQRKGVDVLSTPEVLTKSGHRARVEVVREFIYPTEFEPPEIPQDFGGGGGFGVINLVTGQGFGSSSSGGGAFPVTPTMPTTFESKKLGHVFEVEATVGPDNRTIDLDVLPSYSDFEGFVNYGTPIQTYVSSNQAPIVLTPNEILQPVFKSSRSDGPIKVTLYSGATMVIVALNMEETQSVEDKTPILGDLPFIGQLFRTHAQRVKQKAVVFSLKATVVDPAGETPHSTPAELAGQ